MASYKDVWARRFLNSQQPINKLPPEILSWIFAAVVDQGCDRTEEWNYRGIVALRVCSFWRDVVIDDPTFWRRIHVTSSLHLQLALLYLERSGSRLVDMDFDFRRRYWDSLQIDTDDYENQVSHIQHMTSGLLGRYVHRWRSLRIHVTRSEVMVPFISIINVKKAPALLSLSWKREAIEGERISVPLPESVSKPCNLLGLSLASLKELDFSKLPVDFLFDPDPTTFPCLAKLRLSLSAGPHDRSKLRKFLAVNPQLESLDLETGVIPLSQKDWRDTTSVSLPSLHRLTLRFTHHGSWLLQVMKTIDAPKLYHLAIHTPPWRIKNPSARSYAYYIERSHPSSALGRTARPFSPSLREIDISNFSCDESMRVRMFRALPPITHLCMSGEQADLLCRYPTLLPRLACIRVSPLDDSVSRFDLRELVRVRAEAGHPIQTVQVSSGLSPQVKKILPDAVEIQVWDELCL